MLKSNYCFFFSHADQPEGVAAQSTPLYTIADRDLTIVSYINASGNPELSSDWFINDDIISGHKYNASVTGQLTISLVSTNDTANYTNALENSVGMINRTVEVIVVGKFAYVICHHAEKPS